MLVITSGHLRPSSNLLCDVLLLLVLFVSLLRILVALFGRPTFGQKFSAYHISVCVGK